MDRYGYVYLVHCIPTGEYYVGRKKYQSKSEKCSSTSYLGAGLLLKKRLKEHDKSCFQKRILVETRSTEESDFYEVLFIEKCIRKHGSLCINIALGGKNGGSPILRHPDRDEINRKRGEKMKGRRLSLGMTGKSHSEEARRKMAEKKMGHTPWNKGKSGYLSDESRLALSASLKGRIPWNKGKHSEEVIRRREERKNNPKGMTGKSHSEATRTAISLRNKGNIPPNRLQIARLNDNLEILEIYPSRRHASDEGYSTAHVSANSNLTIRSRGFYFRYLKDLSEEEIKNKICVKPS